MVSLLPLRWKNYNWLGSQEDQFFLSFADAWRGIIKRVDIKVRKILVPDFYCPETLAMYKNYGTLLFYKTNQDLTIDIPSYLMAVKSYRPDVIINYGYISSPLQDNNVRSLLGKLPETIVIEDCAHRIVLKEDLVFVHSNHFYIDSIRKQTGILGSHLVDQSQLLKKEHFSRMNSYKIKSTWFKFLQEAINLSTYLVQSRKLYEKSEIYFEKLDNLIGTYEEPTLGSVLSGNIWNHLDLRKLIEHKRELASAYLKRLVKIQHKSFLVPPLADKNLSYFVCLVSSPDNEQLIDYLSTKNIWVGSLWDYPTDPEPGLNKTLFQSVVVLPLTWKTTVRDVFRVCQGIEQFFID
jgi:hypothetical protein